MWTVPPASSSCGAALADTVVAPCGGHRLALVQVVQGTIYYTTDGTLPSSNSPTTLIYASTIYISNYGETTIRAMVSGIGLTDSGVLTELRPITRSQMRKIAVLMAVMSIPRCR